MGKYITIGMGASRAKDAATAAKEAATQAIKGFKKAPAFSIAFVNADASPAAVLTSLNAILGTNWVGVSADKQFNSTHGYHPDTVVSVVSFNTDYLHFGVGVSEKYRSSPEESGEKTAQQAVMACKADKYVDSYIQFTRAKKKDYGAIIRTPPYFVLAFLSGVKMKDGVTTPGQEAEFISGVLNYTGPHVPMFGGSASSSLEKYLKGEADNFQFANGKLYRDAAIVVFVVSDMLFHTQVEHGYDTTKQFAAVTGLDKTGYEILELNGREPVEEIAKLLSVSKKKYLKNVETLAFTRPFGLVQADGTAYVKEVLPNKDGKTLHSNFKLYPNSVLNVLEFDKRKTVGTLTKCLDDAGKEHDTPPAFGLFCVCSGRRPLVKGIESKELDAAKKAGHRIPIFGFYSFSEVGSTRKTSAQSHSQTITSLVMYDKLLSE